MYEHKLFFIKLTMVFKTKPVQREWQAGLYTPQSLAASGRRGSRAGIGDAPLGPWGTKSRSAAEGAGVFPRVPAAFWMPSYFLSDTTPKPSKLWFL